MSVVVRHELLLPQTGDYRNIPFAEVLGFSATRVYRLQKLFNDRSCAGMPHLLRTQGGKQQYCEYLQRFYDSVLTNAEKERLVNKGEIPEFSLYLLGKELRMGKKRKKIQEGEDMDYGTDTGDDEEDEVEGQSEEPPTIGSVNGDKIAARDLRRPPTQLASPSYLDTKLTKVVNEAVSGFEKRLANMTSLTLESLRAGPVAAAPRSLRARHSLALAMHTTSDTPSSLDRGVELSSSSHALNSTSLDHRIGSFLISAPGISSQVFRVPITSVGTYSGFCQVARTLFVIAEDPCLVRTDTPNDSIIHPVFWDQLVGMLDKNNLIIAFPAVKPGFTLSQPDLSSFNLTIHYRFSPYLNLLEAPGKHSSECLQLATQLQGVQFPTLLLTVSTTTTLAELKSVITMDAASHLLTTERYERRQSLVVDAGRMAAAHSRWPSNAPDGYCISEYTFATMLQPRLRLYCELQDVQLQVGLEEK